VEQAVEGKVDVQQQQEEEEEAPNSSFKQHVHDVFMQDFSTQMLDMCGVLVFPPL
jgi:hypothetical protein